MDKGKRMNILNTKQFCKLQKDPTKTIEKRYKELLEK